MNQRTRSLVTLAALLALAGGAALFAYYGVHQKQQREQAAKEKKEKLFPDFDKAKVKGLSVTAKGALTVLQPKAGGADWEIVSPIQVDADMGAIDSLLDRLGTVKSKRVVEEKSADLAKFGLDKPSLKVVAKLDGAPDLVLRIGAENEYDSSMYVALGEAGEVLQSEGGLKYAFEKDTFDLRDKRLLPFEEEKAQALDVRVDQNRFALSKQSGKWALSSPLAERADDATANRLVSSLRNLRATKITAEAATADELQRAGLGKPKAEITVSLAGGARMTLALAQATGKTFARRGEAKSIAEVPDSILTDLNAKLLDLRDKTVLPFERDAVQKITLAMGGESVELERVKAAPDAGAPDSWKLSGAAPGAARQAKVSSLLWSLGALKAVAFADESPTDLAKYGLDKPARSVALLGEGAKELATLQIGSDVNSNVYVRNGADKRVFEVEKSRIDELPKGRADVEEIPAAPDAGATRVAK
jgi:hypothetical protein